MFGARVTRLEDPDLLTGKARFVDDFGLPGTLHGAFLRSPHPHASIRSINTEAARAMEGVHAIYTRDDLPAHLRDRRLLLLLPNPAITQPLMPPLLAGDEVCYVGEARALVIAETRHVAEDAAAVLVSH